MVLDNIKSMRKDRGFTIVELLVVIVVIGILASITIVSYTGVTNRAKTSKSKSNAAAVQTVAEVMNADNGFYPALAVGTLANFGITGGSQTAKLPSGMTIIPDNIGGTLLTATTSVDGTVAAYSCLTSCTASTGGRIAYWNFDGSGTREYIYVGAGTSGGTYAAPSS